MQKHSSKPLFSRAFSNLFFAGLIFLSPAYVSPSLLSFRPTPQFVALTFDDGPHPAPTYRLCDTLSRHNVPATFFVVGRIAVQHPEVLDFLARSGHQVDSHTWNHHDIRFQSSEALRRELDRTRLLIRDATGRDTFLFRTPGSTEQYLRKHFQVPAGYQLVLWDVHSLDQEGGRPQEIADRVLAEVKSGDIILMHNGLRSTEEALDIIIPELESRGFMFVTVDDILRNRSNSRLFVRKPVSLKGEVWTR